MVSTRAIAEGLPGFLYLGCLLVAGWGMRVERIARRRLEKRLAEIEAKMQALSAES